MASIGLVVGAAARRTPPPNTQSSGIYKTTFLRLCQIRHSEQMRLRRCHPNTHERN